MKKVTFLLFFLTLSMFSSIAQYTSVAYVQSISTEGYEGSRFRLRVSMRTEVEDDSASARLWVRVDKKVGVGFFENMWEQPVRNSEWDTYTIEGKIDSAAYRIAFGAICEYNGRFFYDNFELAVETDDAQWMTLFADDFEENAEDSVLSSKPWKLGPNEKYSAEIHRGNSAGGQQCLLITGKGVPNFGVNDEAGQYAEVNGIRLYYEVYGEGQPLVILNGSGGSISDGARFYPYFLDKNYQLIAIDSRGHGRSGDTGAELTYELMASDVNELLNQLDIDSVYLWGHFDGAILGLVLALNHPDKVKKVVAFTANIVPDSTGIEPPILHWMEKEVRTTKDPIDRKFITLILNHPNIPFSELKKIQAEILLMSGDRDFVPLAHTLKIFQHLPKAQLCIIPGATYNAAKEKPELFQQLVSDFFEKPFVMPSTVDWYKK